MEVLRGYLSFPLHCLLWGNIFSIHPADGCEPMLLIPGQRVDIFYWVYCQRIRASGALISWMLFLTRIPTSRCYRKPINVDLSQMLTSGMLSAGGRRSRLHLSGRCGPPYHPLRLMYMRAYVVGMFNSKALSLSVCYSIKSDFIIRIVHLILLGENWS